ncbi:MAG: VTT domain-containing protein [Candidatus Magasanikbacteria bacterium]|nr:VTT domain-containing protein [Candidatus Magasanikbacteria bacterium]
MTSEQFLAMVAWVLAHGYYLIFLAMLIEGPLVSAAAAFGASLGYFDLWIICALSFLGDIIADLVYYALGYFGLMPLISKFLPAASAARYSRIKELLTRHGSKSIVIMKYTPLLPLPGFIALGAARFSLKRFLLVGGLATIPRTVIFIIIGYYSGFFFTTYKNYIANAPALFFIIALFFVAAAIIYNRVSALAAKRLANSP